MARTLSSMMPLKTKAPNFSLPDTVSGKHVELYTQEPAQATVVMFLCNHCPFVKHVREELARIGQEYQEKGVSFYAISSNDVVNYPDDSPELMSVEASDAGYTFPYLYDESQEVARAYDAQCTPDFFLFDAALECVYRGQLDDSRPDNGIPVTGNSLRKALDAVLRGEGEIPEQKPSMGCNIKWK